MPIVVFEHHPLETSVRLGQVLRDEGHRLVTLKLHEGDAVPPDLDDVDAVISMGGPMDVDQTDEHAWMQPEMDFLKSAHDAGRPVVGVCLGAQLLAKALGGEVAKMETPEVGWGKLSETFFGQMDPLFAGLPWHSWQFHLHGYEITKAPPGGTPIPLAGSGMCKCQAFKVGLKTYGFQYHFESTKQNVAAVVDANDQMVRNAGETPENIAEQTEKYFDMYRHLGDRLCERIATILIPLEHRLPTTGGHEPTKNYRPAQS